jgi:hypothetical protein
VVADGVQADQSNLDRKETNGGEAQQPILLADVFLTAATAGLDLIAGKVDLRSCPGLFHVGL